MKKCPFCAEEIQDAAVVCRFCNRELTSRPPAPPPAAPPQPAAKSEPATTKRSAFPLVAAVLGFALAFASPLMAGVGFFLIWIGIGLGLSGSGIVRWGGGFLLALMLASVGAGMGGSRSVSPSAPATITTAPAKPTATPPVVPAARVVADQLALVAARGYESEYGNYHYVEGQVRNISDAPIKNVTAVATWYDKDGTFIKSTDAIIDYNPILPGQTSPFKTITSGNPAMAKFTVEFKTLFGGALRVADQRKKK